MATIPTTQTEFTCGIYNARFIRNEWDLQSNEHDIATISPDGQLINFIIFAHLTCDMIIEIAVLMNNIKRQYKQLQTPNHE
jgi:hypothetical protein